MEHRFGADFVLPAVAFVHDHLLVAVLLRVDERAAGVDGDALGAKGGLDFGGDVVVKRLENARATLKDGDRDVEPRKKLGEFERHRTAAEHDDRAGQRLEPQGVVAGDAAELGQAWQRQVGHS